MVNIQQSWWVVAKVWLLWLLSLSLRLLLLSSRLSSQWSLFLLIEVGLVQRLCGSLWSFRAGPQMERTYSGSKGFWHWNSRMAEFINFGPLLCISLHLPLVSFAVPHLSVISSPHHLNLMPLSAGSGSPFWDGGCVAKTPGRICKVQETLLSFLHPIAGVMQDVHLGN